MPSLQDPPEFWVDMMFMIGIADLTLVFMAAQRASGRDDVQKGHGASFYRFLMPMSDVADSSGYRRFPSV